MPMLRDPEWYVPLINHKANLPDEMNKNPSEGEVWRLIMKSACMHGDLLADRVEGSCRAYIHRKRSRDLILDQSINRFLDVICGFGLTILQLQNFRDRHP